MQESHAIDATLGQEMFHLLLKGEFVDHLVLDNGFIELLIG